MRYFFQSVLAALLFTVPAFATDIPQSGPPKADAPKTEVKEVPYAFYLISCGKYIEHRGSGNPNDNYNAADMYYAAGWLSAYNRMRPDGGIPEDTTLDNVMLWLEQYCRANPLSNLDAGLYKLGDEMRGKK